jgi:hypothetical protein
MSLFFNIIPQYPDLGTILQLSWQKLGSLILLTAELVTSQVLLRWPKNNSPMGKVSTIVFIFFKFSVVTCTYALKTTIGFTPCSNQRYVILKLWADLASEVSTSSKSF